MDSTGSSERAEVGRSAVVFGKALLNAWRHSRGENIALSLRLRNEISASERMLGTHIGTKEDEEMFEQKMLRFRPRLLGALASYVMLSGFSYDEANSNGGMQAFRAMWFLGSAQDDLIDAKTRGDLESSGEPPQLHLTRAIFGRERGFYRAMYAVIRQEISKSELQGEPQRYLEKKVADWYLFLTAQETGVITADFSSMDFSYCRSYREDQNLNIGAVLVAMLNGKHCAEEKYQQLEQTVGVLSLRTQIIDDIADIFEDLEARRPSYAIGALVDHPDELREVERLSLTAGSRKMTPTQFSRAAPRSYALVKAQFDRYGERLSQNDGPQKLLAGLGDVLFSYFPRFRDVMYRINPRNANF